MPRWLALFSFSFGQGGLAIALATLVGAIALRRFNLSERQVAVLRPLLVLLVGVSIAMELIVTTWYLFVPGYQDHIEASVVSVVHYFRAGLPVYPALDSYTFNGLVYGPLLIELSSLGYLLPAGAFAAKVIGWLCGWLAVTIILATNRLGAAGWTALLGCAYALCLLVAFGSEMTTGRSESLLLLISTLALVVALHWQNARGALALGVLCGAAIGLKLHGPLYCLPALSVWALRIPADQWRTRGVVLVGCFAAAAAVTLVLPFLPSAISLEGYLTYLALALKHGLSSELFVRTLAFFIGSWAPLWLLLSGYPKQRMSAELRTLVWVLMGTELLVVVVASKPGAGVHHLLPFLGAHAYLFQRLYIDTKAASPGSQTLESRALVAIAATVLGTLWPAVHNYSRLLEYDIRIRELNLQRDEVLRFADQYPGGMLGVASPASYELANLRPWITSRGTAQTDFGALMDLKLSGIDDAPLARAFASCSIPFVYVPRPGAPFTMITYYGGGPLFSAAVREAFANGYFPVAKGRYFDVFACRSARQGTPSGAQSLDPTGAHN